MNSNKNRKNERKTDVGPSCHKKKFWFGFWFFGMQLVSIQREINSLKCMPFVGYKGIFFHFRIF